MTDREVARPGTGGGDAAPWLSGRGRLALLAGSVTVLVTASLAGSALALLSKAACRAGAWNVGVEQFQAHCYTDIYPLYFSEGLSKGQVPYLGHPVEYPVIIGAAMQAAAWIVSPISDQVIRGREFFDVTAAMLTLCTVAAVLATAYLAGPARRWTALLVALSPAVILAAFINWDLIAMSLATLGMAAWAGRRGVLAGVLLGLAVATKFYPVFLLGPLFLLCLRAGLLGPSGSRPAPPPSPGWPSTFRSPSRPRRAGPRSTGSMRPGALTGDRSGTSSRPSTGPSWAACR